MKNSAILGAFGALLLVGAGCSPGADGADVGGNGGADGAASGGSGNGGQNGSGGSTASGGKPGVPVTGECAGKARIGDPGSAYDEGLDDPAYPVMKEWAKAGVEGGIPQVAAAAVELTPADGLAGIQAAIDGLEVKVSNGARPAEFKVVLLKDGRYELNGGELNPILTVKSGVILRGESRDGTVLSFTTARDGAEYDFSVGLKNWSGLESLTVTNQYVEQLPEESYIGKFENSTATGVGAHLSGVTLQGDNSWVQGTRVSKIGTHPIFVGGKHHCTMRDNIVEKSLNKGGGGRGYYYFASEASYNLVYHDTISDLRHFTYLLGVHHNVVLNVTSRVDFNFHNKPQMPHNLFEGIQSAIPDSHRWGKGGAWGFGWYTVDVTQEDQNIAYRMSTLPGYPDTKAYIILRDYSGEPDSYSFLETAAPRAGTFYPVTGCREAPPAL